MRQSLYAQVSSENGINLSWDTHRSRSGNLQARGRLPCPVTSYRVPGPIQRGKRSLYEMKNRLSWSTSTEEFILTSENSGRVNIDGHRDSGTSVCDTG